MLRCLMMLVQQAFYNPKIILKKNDVSSFRWQSQRGWFHQQYDDDHPDDENLMEEEDNQHHDPTPPPIQFPCFVLRSQENSPGIKESY